MEGIIAHRGASGYAPENTCAAFLKAKALGCQWIECDVQLAACGTPVIIHDDTVDRTTEGTGKVAALTYAQLKQWDAGSWFHPRFADERIPTLNQVLSLCQRQQLYPQIELKVTESREVQPLIRAVVAELQKLPAAYPVLLSSFNWDCLKTLKKEASEVPWGALFDQWEEEWFDQMASEGAHLWSGEASLLTSDRVSFLKFYQRPLLAYTVNDVSEAVRLCQMRVSGIFTDFPDRIHGGSYQCQFHPFY